MLYKINLWLIVGVLAVAFVVGIAKGHVALTLLFIAVFYVTPLSNIFLILNVWGLLRSKTHRMRYIIVIVILIIWGIWGWYEMITMPFP